MIDPPRRKAICTFRLVERAPARRGSLQSTRFPSTAAKEDRQAHDVLSGIRGIRAERHGGRVLRTVQDRIDGRRSTLVLAPAPAEALPDLCDERRQRLPGVLGGLEAWRLADVGARSVEQA